MKTLHLLSASCFAVLFILGLTSMDVAPKASLKLDVEGNITIMASVRESANPGGYTEIFEDAGAYTDLRNKVDGFYTFKVSCGGTDKWYGFWVGPRG